MDSGNPLFNPTRSVDVIVPVYKSLRATRRCLESLFVNPQLTSMSVVVIDDASPEDELREYLDRLAQRNLIILLSNKCNMGFVGSVNRGMSLHPDRDVVLLNSDTEVANDWLDRLSLCAYSDNNIGTVTPFTNNGTICTYPYEGWQGGLPGCLGISMLDRLFAQTNYRLSANLPTAVGFCMYIRRSCLDQVGLFDVERFGRGYGEENDFSMRAAQSGWRNVLAADVFVYHEGAVSFSEERHAQQQVAMASLLALHPNYLDLVQDFIRQDPLAPLRASVDRARGWHGPVESRHVLVERLARPCGQEVVVGDSRPVLLHLTHSWGGGTERWVSDFIQGDHGERNLVLRSRSERNLAGWRLELIEPAVTDIPIQAWNLDDPIRATARDHVQYQTVLRGVIEIFGVQSLIISSLLGHSLDALDTGLPTVIVQHDMYPFCPAMFGFFQQPCVECKSEKLSACLESNPLNVFWHNTVAEEWLSLRRTYFQLLGRPGINLTAPTRDVHARWAKLQPEIAHKSWHLIPHGIDTKHFANPGGYASAHADRKRLRIVVPGRLLPHKGLDLLWAVRADLLDAADVLLLGCGEFGNPFIGMAGIEVIKDYRSEGLTPQLRAFDPDCALLLSIVPESFSYTLSEMRALYIPVIATRIGAFAERIEHGVDGLLFDPEPSSLIAILRSLVEDRAQLTRIKVQLTEMPVRSLTDMVLDYQALVPEMVGKSRGVGDIGLIGAVMRQGELEREVSWLRGEYHRMGLRVRTQIVEKDLVLRDVNALRSELEALKTDRKELRASTSWRVTAPMRRLKQLLMRLTADSTVERPGVSAGKEATYFAQGAQTPSGVADVGTFQVEQVPERADIRTQVRHEYGVPDRTRLILCLGQPSNPNDAACLMKMIEVCLGVRNDISVLLAEANVDATVWAKQRRRLLRHQANRRLFLVRTAAVRTEVIAASDAVIVAGEVDSMHESIGLVRHLNLPLLLPGTKDMAEFTAESDVVVSYTESTVGDLAHWLADQLTLAISAQK